MPIPTSQLPWRAEIATARQDAHGWGASNHDGPAPVAEPAWRCVSNLIESEAAREVGSSRLLRQLLPPPPRTVIHNSRAMSSSSVPLTTTFTPPSECLNTIYAGPNAPVVFGPPTSTSSCYPSGWTEATTFYFSPGTICPSVWSH
jgi:hypothetical protein